MEIKLNPVKSSRIHSIGHDETTETLAICFLTKNKGPGSVYHYKNFSEGDFFDFENAESIGSHFNRHIKNNHQKYPYKKIS